MVVGDSEGVCKASCRHLTGVPVPARLGADDTAKQAQVSSACRERIDSEKCTTTVRCTNLTGQVTERSKRDESQAGVLR